MGALNDEERKIKALYLAKNKALRDYFNTDEDDAVAIEAALRKRWKTEHEWQDAVNAMIARSLGC